MNRYAARTKFIFQLQKLLIFRKCVTICSRLIFEPLCDLQELFAFLAERRIYRWIACRCRIGGKHIDDVLVFPLFYLGIRLACGKSRCLYLQCTGVRICRITPNHVSFEIRDFRNAFFCPPRGTLIARRGTASWPQAALAGGVRGRLLPAVPGHS